MFKKHIKIRLKKNRKKLLYFTKNKKYLYNKKEQELNKYYFYLKVIESGYLTENQLEAARKVIVRYTKRKLSLSTVTPILISKTKKPNEVRMGKGKGNIDKWILPIKKGTILFILNITDNNLKKKYKKYKEIAKKGLKFCCKKLPLKCHVKYL